MSAIWYDKEAGSAGRLDYDAGGAGIKTAHTMTGMGDKQWQGKFVTATRPAEVENAGKAKKDKKQESGRHYESRVTDSAWISCKQDL